MARSFDALVDRLKHVEPSRIEGRLDSVVGLALRAALPNARLGDLCTIESRGRDQGRHVLAEIVGFEHETAVLMPYGSIAGLAPGDVVVSSGAPLTVRVGDALIGRVLDGMGRAFDGADGGAGPGALPTAGTVLRPIVSAPPHPLTRARIDAPMVTGVRALDGLLTLGVGQRLGLFAGSGVGKSTLLGQIARQSQADVVVVNLVGERGREVREFLEDALGEEGRAKSVVVCATSDMPALVRVKSAHVATSIAEHFRDQGRHVLLLMDSVTRFARAAREVALAAGEPPARRGYPPSVFAQLPVLLERSGTAARGAITAIYTVLVEGGDLDEPIADEVRGILDGHVVLARTLGERGRFPAIDVLQSLSRTMPFVTTPAHREHATRLRTLVAAYEHKRDLVQLGAYTAGADPTLDRALERLPAIEAFLGQRPDETSSLAETLARLEGLG